MVGDLKTTEIEYSLRFAPLIDGLSADEAVRRAYQGLIKKLVDLSAKPDAGKAFKVRLIFSANLPTRLLLRQYDSNARAVVGPLKNVSAMMSEFSLDAKLAELMSTARFRSR